MFKSLFLIGWLVCSMVAAPPEGAELYEKHCAVCHNSPETRAPSRETLSKMSPGAVFNALVSGTMAHQAAKMSVDERRTIAEFLTGKTVAADVATEGPGAGACPAGAPAFSNPLSGARWNGWGVDPANTRFQPAAMAGLTAAEVPRLKLKWAFGFPGATSAPSQPTVAGGRVFVGSATGVVYSLDAATGCTYWSYKAATSPARAAISIGPRGGGSGRYAAYAGDHQATVHALDAATGELLWKTRVEEHPMARITGAPLLHAGRLYVPVSSHEETRGFDPKYECCRFRGSVVALDAETGKQIWKTYSIGDPPAPTRKNKSGTQLWGPAGGAIWSSPTLDLKRRAIYVATGNSYTEPDPGTTDAILALDMDTGKMLWSQQMTKQDWFTIGCRKADNCPDPVGPDFDFGSSPMLRSLPDGRRVLVCAQKSGMAYALDPDQEGKLIWGTRVGKGSALGGVQFGPASDDEFVYVANSDVLSAPPQEAGGLFALGLATGENVWHTPAPKLNCTGGRGCTGAQSAAVTAIPGVVFSGSIDGHLRAYSTADGKILWDFNTVEQFATVNGVKGQGGSLDGPGPTVVNGIVYGNSGYGAFRGISGNLLLAFSVDGK